MSTGRPARRALAALAAALAAAAPGVVAAAPGDPDPRFDVDGRRAFGYGGDDRATDVALLPDGRIVMAGWTTVNGDLFVTRLTRRGAFDPRFGRAGTTDLDLGGDDRATVGPNLRVRSVAAGWRSAPPAATRPTTSRCSPTGGLWWRATAARRPTSPSSA